MHAISYLQKRAHLSACALGRKMLASIPDVTPARFDLLHVIYDRGRVHKKPEVRQLEQATARALLGLARQTIWKMVKRLVELGLIAKRRHPFHRRWIVLELTAEGFQRIRRAYGVTFTARYDVSEEDGGNPAPKYIYRRVRKNAHWEDRTAAFMKRCAPGLLPPHLNETFWPSHAPPKIGREVTRVFTKLAWDNGGPDLGRRDRALDKLRGMVTYARAMADALGDESALIYRQVPEKPTPKKATPPTVPTSENTVTDDEVPDTGIDTVWFRLPKICGST